MNKILCSTGAFTGRSNGYNYRLLEPLSKALTFDENGDVDIEMLNEQFQKIREYRK